ALRQAQLHLLRHPELIEKMPALLKKQLNNRGLPAREDQLAFAAAALVGLARPVPHGSVPWSSAAILGAPVAGDLWRGPQRQAQPLPQAGPNAAPRLHPAYWAGFVLSGDIR